MSFPRYPAYKPSGVEWLGEVPAGWTVCAVRRILRGIEQGWSPDCLGRPATSEEWGVLKAGCVNRGVYAEAENKALPDELSPVPEYEVRVGDVLMSRASGSPELVGSTALVTTTRPKLMLSDKVFRLRIDAAISPTFFVAALNSRILRAQIERAISGADGLANNLPQSALRSFLMAVPPAPEQGAIAAFLDRETARIDALVAEQERLIELLREKRQAVISHAVTKGLDPNVPMKESGVEWLGEVPAHWELQPMKRLIGPVDQGGSPQCESEPASLDRWGVLKVGCMNGGVFRQDEQKALPEDVAPDARSEIREGDILMSRGNTLDLVGSAAVVPSVRPRLLLSDLVYRFRARGTVAPRFLCYVLGSAVGRHQLERDAVGTSASMKKVSKEVLANLLIPSPAFEEQGRIAKFLDEHGAITDALITSATHAITLLQERRAALITAAVTGQIDVRGVA